MSEGKTSKIIHEIEEKPSLFIKVLNTFTLISTVICYGIIGYLLIFHIELIKLFFTDYQQLQDFITPELKIPIFLISLFFGVILSIYPFAQIIPITSMIAFFFGFKWGMLFGSLSFFISTALIMTLSRHLGNKVVRKIIGHKNWSKAKILADEEGSIPFLIAYVFPVFPNSIISWIAGITNVSIIKLSIGALIAQLPGIAISVMIGSGLITENFYLTGGLFVFLVAIAYTMNRNRKAIINVINRKR